jgi:hypothetical protein
LSIKLRAELSELGCWSFCSASDDAIKLARPPCRCATDSPVCCQANRRTTLHCCMMRMPCRPASCCLCLPSLLLAM